MTGGKRSATDFWRENRHLRHLTPPGERWPEKDLPQVLEAVCVPKVLEFGCGDGRLASLFEPEEYIGVDINPFALSEARRRLPEHDFRPVCFPQAETLLAHTVLLHVPDDEIESTLIQFSNYPRIVIGEVMGRKWRRPKQKQPPVFNRDPEEYEQWLEDRRITRVYVKYPRYETFLTMIVADRF